MEMELIDLISLLVAGVIIIPIIIKVFVGIIKNAKPPKEKQHIEDYGSKGETKHYYSTTVDSDGNTIDHYTTVDTSTGLSETHSIDSNGNDSYTYTSKY